MSPDDPASENTDGTFPTPENAHLGADGVDELSSFHFIRDAQQSGSQDAWVLIYERYYTRALLYSELQLGPELRKYYSAEDLIQEVWLRLVKAIEQFDYRGKDSFFAWLCQHIRWVAASWGRKSRPNVVDSNHDDTVSSAGMDKYGTKEPGPRTLVGGKDVVAMLRESLEKVPELYREVLVEVLIEGRDRSEVAYERGEKSETLRKQVNRGLEKWRESLGGIDPTDFLQ